MDLNVQERNQHRADEHVVAHQIHRDLTRPACETGRKQIEDCTRTGEASIHDHDGLLDGEESDRRETDAEDGYRARGLNDERQERGDEEGNSERIPGSFQHFPEPGLLGERCRGVLEEDETEDDQRAPEEGPGHGPEPRQSLADQNRAGEPEHVERNDLDVEGDDHHEGGYADAPAKDQGKRAPGRDEPGAKDAHHDEGHRGHALGDGAGEGSPDKGQEPVPGPPTRGPSQPTGRQCLQVLREEPHPHDEEAKAACDPCEEFVHACVDVAV